MRRPGTSEDFDPLVAAWLDADPDRAPAAVLDGVLAAFPSIHQRRRSMTPSWSPRRRFAVVGTAWAVVLVAVAAALLAIARPWSSSVGGSGRPVIGPGTSSILKEWSPNDDVAVTITRDPADGTDYYWRAATFDAIGLRGWTVGSTAETSKQANARLLDSFADDVTAAGQDEISITVQPGSFDSSIVLTPGIPSVVDQPVTLVTSSVGGYLSTVERNGNGRYSLTALVGRAGDGPGEWNDAALRTAGTAYPAEINERYLGVMPESIGPNAYALEQEIAAAAGSSAPIDLVEAAMHVLRSNAFTYDTDVSGLPCQSLSTVECFATYKRGFCQYYAATMAVLLRDRGVPTRIVEGFLPGTRTGGTEVIRNRSASAWVEVYFPGYGWVPFDPTGSQDPTRLPAALPS